MMAAVEASVRTFCHGTLKYLFVYSSAFVLFCVSLCVSLSFSHSHMHSHILHSRLSCHILRATHSFTAGICTYHSHTVLYCMKATTMHNYSPRNIHSEHCLALTEVLSVVLLNKDEYVLLQVEVAVNVSVFSVAISSLLTCICACRFRGIWALLLHQALADVSSTKPVCGCLKIPQCSTEGRCLYRASKLWGKALLLWRHQWFLAKKTGLPIKVNCFF